MQHTDCPICKHIKGHQSSNIGRGEYYPKETEEAVKKLEELGEKWRYGYLRVYRCPLCGSFYFEEVQESFTGTGFDDNQCLLRAQFRADDKISQEGKGFYNEMAEILSKCEKKDDREIIEVLNKIQKIH